MLLVGELNSRPLAVTEGVADALAAARLFNCPATALLGKAVQWPTVQALARLGAGAGIYLDGDRPGREAAQRLAAEIGRAGGRSSLWHPPREGCDPADLARDAWLATERGLRKRADG